MKATLWLSLAVLTVAYTAALAADWDWSADPVLNRAVLTYPKGSDPNDPNNRYFPHGFWDFLSSAQDPNSLDAYQTKRLAHLGDIAQRGFNFMATFFRLDPADPNGCDPNTLMGCNFSGDPGFVAAADEVGVKVMPTHLWNPKVCNSNDWNTRNIANFAYLPVLAWYMWDDADSCVDMGANCPTGGVWDSNYPGSFGCHEPTQWMCWQNRLTAIDCRSEAIEAVDGDAYTLAFAGYRDRGPLLVTEPGMDLDLYMPELYTYPNRPRNYPSMYVTNMIAAYGAQTPVICMSFVGETYNPLEQIMNVAYQTLANGAVGITYNAISRNDGGYDFDLTGDPNDPNAELLGELEVFRSITNEFEGALLNGTLYRVSGFDDPNSPNDDPDDPNNIPNDPVLATYWLYDRSDGEPDELWLVVVNISNSSQSLSVPLPLAYNLHLEQKDAYGTSNISWAYQSNPRNYLLSGTLATDGYYVAKFTTENENATTKWCLGDMNCDGTVGLADINAFSTALSYPPSYATAYPGCPMVYNGDANGDRKLTTADINSFVAWVSQNPAPTCP